MSSSHNEHYLDALKKLRTRDGLNLARLNETQVDISALLAAPTVRERVEATGEASATALLETVKTLVANMPSTDRLVLDAALCLRLTLERSDHGYGELYAPDLMHRRNALVANWAHLHRLTGLDRAPKQPSVTSLRTKAEEEAFASLTRLLVVGDPLQQSATKMPRRNGNEENRRAFVFGSALIDQLYRIPRLADLPVVESVQASSYKSQPGGIALTEAVALAQLGFEVELVAAMGDDAAADEIEAFLNRYGVGTRHLVRLSGETPHVNVITEEYSGHSLAIAWPNKEEISLHPERIARITSELRAEDLAFYTFEIPFEGLKAAMEALSADINARPTIFVTPAPPPLASVLEPVVFSRIDYLVAHPWDLGRLVPDDRLTSDEERAIYLRNVFNLKNVLVCDGNVATAFTDEGVSTASASTVGIYRESAGSREAFTAGLARKIPSRAERETTEARTASLSAGPLQFATSAMAISAMQPGIAAGLPTYEEVEMYVERNRKEADSQ